MKLPVFDLHCDTAFEMAFRKHISLEQNALHIDLRRAGKLSGYTQCFACFTTTEDYGFVRPSARELLKAEYTLITEQIAMHPDKIRLITSGEEIRSNLDSGIISAILTLEGSAGFGFDPQALAQLRNAGFLITSLCWNEKNCLTGSHSTGEGLTQKGREFVHIAQQNKMLVDVSHISDQAFWDIMDITQAPILATHSNSRAIHNVSRNITDEMFSELCMTGGLAGINLYTEFIGNNGTLDELCDHVFHYLELDPEGDHIALGGDLDGCDRLPESFTGVDSYMLLADRLLQRGITQPLLYKIFWNNALGVIERCCT